METQQEQESFKTLWEYSNADWPIATVMVVDMMLSCHSHEPTNLRGGARQTCTTDLESSSF